MAEYPYDKSDYPFKTFEEELEYRKKYLNTLSQHLVLLWQQGLITKEELSQQLDSTIKAVMKTDTKYSKWTGRTRAYFRYGSGDLKSMGYLPFIDEVKMSTPEMGKTSDVDFRVDVAKTQKT